MNKPAPRYRVERDNIVPKFPWLVVDADGVPALSKVSRVTMRFRTRALAQVAADALNRTGRGGLLRVHRRQAKPPPAT